MKQNKNEINEGMIEKSFFHLFRVDINEFWNYFMDPSFATTYFYDNCKVTNLKNINRKLKEKDVLDLYYQDKNIKVKLLIENIIDSPNYKSITFKLIDQPDDITPFTAIDSFYFCSHSNITGLLVKIITPEDKERKNFILNYLDENKGIIFKNIEKYIEINFKEAEETESIAIRKSGNEVFDYLTTKNYTNLKILLGNNALITPTSNPNEIEVEHFTRNNKAKFMVSKKIDFNEKELLIQLVESKIPIPRQLTIIKIININKNDCLVMFTHKIKEYISNDIIFNYSILKKKLLWLLKSTIEG